MKKIKLMMMALLVSVVAVGCSSASNGETNTPATEPIIRAPSASVTSHGAVIATRPASEAFKHIETSGLP